MWYHVSFGGNNEPPLCTCKEWESSHLPCKHMFAVFRHNPDWGFDKLPDTYRNSPFFSLDEEIIFPVINIDTAEQPADIEPQDVPSHPDISEKENASILANQRNNNTLAVQCKDLQNQVKSLSYIVDDASKLEDVRKCVQHCVSIMEKSAPKASNGFLLERPSTKSSQPKNEAKYKKTSDTTSTSSKTLG